MDCRESPQTYRIDAYLKSKLAEAARTENRSKSQITRDALRLYLQQNNQKK
ncbi:MAG: ribbon-helix-helix domain-containing protein [Hassallia sp. WJT32-NPBG1]|jgi:predicted transcriptional regulator|nr:ribbon-helix-helix domain-containing protein [Hassallia sp. WJT32-NPBG1]